MHLRGLICVLPLIQLFVAPQLRAQSDHEAEKPNEPSRPGLTRPAEIQPKGVLQIEVGADNRRRGEEFHSAHSVPVTLRYSLLKSLAIEADLDTVVSEVERPSRLRQTGVGDMLVGAQWVGINEAPTHPAVAIGYYEKLPTAASGKELGTGRVDHQLILLLSKKVHQLDLDLDGAYLNVGREERGRVSGALVAISASQEFAHKLGYVAELSNQTLDADLPHGAYATGALTYRLSNRTRLDAGARAGLTADAPRFSVIGGISVGLPLRTIH